MFQRLVLVGWVEDARDLLFSHSELHAPEEQLSRFDKVKDAAAAPFALPHFFSYSHFTGCAESTKCGGYCSAVSLTNPMVFLFPNHL